MKNKRKTKKIFLGLLVITFCTITASVFIGASEKSSPHNNIVDIKISQYSDKNITPNAVATNPEFKNIAFGPVPAKNYVFQNQMASVVRTVKSFLTYQGKKEKEYGSWIWTPVLEMTPTYIESILSNAKANGVNVIYVSIDSYLDIFVMPESEEREANKKLFSDRLEYFIKEAKNRGIAVDAEAGWRNWAEGENVYKAFAIVNYVKNFNETRQNKLRGFQYDVEPYLLDSYEGNEASVLKNFIELVDNTEYFLGESSLRFSVAVPDFYDEKDKLTPKISYNGSKNYVFRHLLNILDRRPDSSIILMSYRNFAENDDGTIDISKNEMRTAKRGRYATKIIIAQETGEVPPPYITFHNTSKKYFSEQVEKINEAFNSYSNFGGIAVHYVNAYLALK